MNKVTRVQSKTMVMPGSDIDTDQIIPARFLTTTTRKGLGNALFADWRYDAAGKPKPDFLLNRPEAAGCGILVAGNNFGCGSSREHAPWALLDFGIHAVISTEIADIFRGNSLKNGLVPVIVDKVTHGWLIENPGVEVTIDVAACELHLPDGRAVSFPIDGFSKYCLLNGVDQLGYLLDHADAITHYEHTRPWKP
ncbi:MAG: 3-isopropylmalate dehydratase small subunit [Chromatiales bacterium]|jgi:3-isopropylmalate/(R)-2-methylmalate dehydratase small subunit|nr:MAG: 3-isopropylmalate dehydratase small subunit [Chromatiales bacterium]